MPLSGPSSGGGSGGPGAVRAGAAYIELFARDKIGGVLDRIAAKMSAFGGLLLKAGAGMTAAGLGILGAVGAPLAALTDKARLIEQLTATLNTSAETVQALGYAFEQFGVPLEKFGQVAGDLQAKIADGTDQLREFGLNARQLGALPVGDQLAAIADQMERLGTGDRASLAEKLGVKDLLPVLARGSAELRKLQQDARGSGLLSGEDVKRAADLGRAFDQTWAQIKLAVLEVGAALLPQAETIKEFAAGVRSTAASVREWLQENKAAVQVVAAVGIGLVAAGVATTAFGVAMKGAALGVGLVSLAVKALGVSVGLVGALFTPVGAVIGAVVGLGAVLATQTETGRGMVSGLKAGFMEFADTAKEAWGGISAAMRKGDFGLAAKIAFSALKVEWAKVVVWWTDAWNDFKSVFVDGWNVIGVTIKYVLTNLSAFILRNTLGSLNQLVTQMARAADAIGLDETAADLRNAASGIMSDEQINRGRDAVLAEDQAAYNRDRLAREAARKADSAAARSDLAAEMEEFRRLREQAGEGKGAGRAAEELRKALPSMQMLADSIKGAFGAAGRLGDQFRTGDKTTMMRQLKATEEIAKNAAALPKIEQKIGDLAAALTFG